ncbi:hypothetical protein [Shimwellia blattae]|uniref:Uncharacterized protein n=1 Tax=Shimwellia blattae (strain ATCC 29907 / DSM 4481 / JCM 1650 / NBRC 105725 / CDC 9005-74) TaxID=630626 RepID=I2B9H2_SHIBC|nr:hypothetical protein [Shimwellia blattae]AFJ47176.1 hypothetical protein EBL_c20850 [Shimwellia blattae DSM 4481 = NBRC 105725]GAB82292.1 hypothetical protein EB105725_21_00900 [Shimwellia blattae DSM 4481 = NBRC 105725]VDY64669.1 Uncharacterised protein [Shimwellia blattae]VEC22774.1 Uncharacterised protein [Shimwellia blattae]
MKIRVTVDQVAVGVNDWALRTSWKTVSIAISEKYHETVGGELLPRPDSETGIRNAAQRVRRIFGLGGNRYRQMASMLTDTALQAMPRDKRLELEEPDSPQLASARLMASYGEAMAALAIRCPTALIKLNRVMDHLHALIPLVEQLIT